MCIRWLQAYALAPVQPRQKRRHRLSRDAPSTYFFAAPLMCGMLDRGCAAPLIRARQTMLATSCDSILLNRGVGVFE